LHHEYGGKLFSDRADTEAGVLCVWYFPLAVCHPNALLVKHLAMLRYEHDSLEIPFNVVPSKNVVNSLVGVSRGIKVSGDDLQRERKQKAVS
jgi:hypothetical protein